jgi:hypothetical protein
MSGSAYVVVEDTGALVWTSAPYTKLFVTPSPFPFGGPAGQGYLILTVKTGYTDPSESAAVVINGKTIGNIDPRPWTNHYVIDLETLIFVFDPSVFGWFVQTLQIVLQGDLNDPLNYLLLGNVICHYQG